MAQFVIDKKKYNIELLKNFQFGEEKIIISSKETDPAYGQDWYNEGYTVINFFNDKNFLKIKNKVKNYIFKITNKNFCLKKYHKFTNDKEHEFLVKKTRDIF